ncbi:PITH domain-containing protein [Lactarius quietus]|nr:PITH domain-containing protein [Lactarius quietus]
MSVIRSEPSLLEHLDLPQSNCLNEIEGQNLKSILANKIKNTTDAYLLSDTDEQLLLNIHFNQTVRIRSIVLHTANPQEGPKKIKLLVNRAAIGFEDVQDAEEPEVAQVLEVPEGTIGEGQPIDLRFVRFQSVNSLHIFIESNHGGVEQTRIDSIDIVGFSVGATKDLSELKKQED